MTDSTERRIRLEHGSGGALSRELVDNVIYPRFRNDRYASLSDATQLGNIENPYLTTDSFVVDPVFFPGGDIGKLAVFGTCNDLAVSGARPVALTLGCILEEGFGMSDFEQILDSIADACRIAGVAIVTGDTKVVPRGSGGGIYLNSAGIGSGEHSGSLGPESIAPGDAVILSGPIGAHGISVLSARERLPVAGAIRSDCANLFPACRELFGLGADLKLMRDATRGGVSAVTNELIADTSYAMLLDEESLPIDADVRAAADILGLNPLEIANEGVFLAIVAGSRAVEAVERIRGTIVGKDACVVGRIDDATAIAKSSTTVAGRVVLETSIGGRRIVDIPRGLLLPRIC